MPQALESIRVVELAEGVSGPYCGKLLAGLGADVLKAEPPAGDRARRAGPFPGDVPDPNRSGLFLHLNTGKRSLTLDTRVAGGRAILARLLADTDVLLTGYSPAELAERSLDLVELSARFPRLVVANASTFGLNGPYAAYAGGELIAYALSGYMHITGLPGREPIKAYGELIEYEAGMQMSVAVMAALLARDLTGHGQVVDVAALEAGTFLLGGAEQPAYFYGEVFRRSGTRNTGVPPETGYPSTIRPCRDGYVHCHVNQRHRDLLGVLIPHPRLHDPELLRLMHGHADEIDAIMDGWLADKGRREAVAMAQPLRLPFTEVLTPGEVLAEPHHIERESFVTVDHLGHGPQLQPGPPFRMHATPWQTLPAPALGAHTSEVLRTLGYSGEQIAQLRSAGAI